MEYVNGFEVRVIIAASGMGTRLGGDIPKQFLPICGEPILKHTLRVFNDCDFIDGIAVAVPKEYMEEVRGYGFDRITHVVEGMPERADSVFAALMALEPFHGVVLVHDGIRLFVTEELIKNVACFAYGHGAAVAGVQINETVKMVDDKRSVINTPDRERFWRAQTPQGFLYDMLVDAYTQAAADGVLHSATDDSSLVERLGQHVYMVHGDPLNMKITTKQDFQLAQLIYAAKDELGT